MSFSFHIVTYGCKVNQYESQALREYWTKLGGVEVDAPAGADLLFLSTCAVTKEAVGEARRKARHWSQLGAQQFIVSGCAATAAPGDFSDFQVAVVPQQRKSELLNSHPLDLPAALRHKLPVAPHAALPGHVPAGAEGMKKIVSAKDGQAFPPFQISSFRRARPVIKVQDGCSHHCAYCIVPFTRGPSCSRPLKDILEEARRLIAAGHREIMLSGVNLRQYRSEEQNFWAVLRALNAELAPEWQGMVRLRLSSLEPAQLNAEGLESLEATTLLCPHIHLSLQSGSAGVLKRMGRAHYSPEFMVEAVGKLGRFWPLFGLGADFLMGFPGESAVETEETLHMVKALPLSYAHVFPWSLRPGTVAATLPNCLPLAQRHEHAALVRALVAEKQEYFLQKVLDSQKMLLVALDRGPHSKKQYCDHTSKKAFLNGVDEHYVPCLVPVENLNDLDRYSRWVVERAESPHTLLPMNPVKLHDGKILCRHASGN